jgi:glycine oxidase
MLMGLRICVAGGGALGSAVALAMQDAGAETILCDPAGLADNASGVAAGMLAPALEAATDAGSAEHFAFLKACRDAWIDLAGRLRAADAIDRSGALWLGEPAARASAFDAIGAKARPVATDEVAALSPGLHAPLGGAFSSEDWRLDPATMLGRLRTAFEEAGGRVLVDAVAAAGAGGAVRRSGRILREDWTVLALGHPSDVALAPELALLAPIKGQILRFAPGSAPSAGPIVRGDGVYIAPSRLGPAAGATMEPGRTDRGFEAAAGDQLRAAAAALYPHLRSASAIGQAGVRTATPDGLPMIGPSAAPGVFLVTGARRNGWLLAALAGRMTVATLAGVDPGPWAAACQPARFGVG